MPPDLLVEREDRQAQPVQGRRFFVDAVLGVVMQRGEARSLFPDALSPAVVLIVWTS